MPHFDHEGDGSLRWAVKWRSVLLLGFMLTPIIGWGLKVPRIAKMREYFLLWGLTDCRTV